MGKTFDKVGLSLTVFLLFFLVAFRVTKSFFVSLICAALFLATVGFFIALIHPKAPKRLLSKRNFIRYVLLKGTGALKDLVETALSPLPCETASDHTVITSDAGRTLVYYAYKFGSLSEEDVAKSYRLAEKHQCDEIYALTNHLDRKSLAVAEYIPQKYNVINASTLYKFLSKKNLIPQKEALPKKNGKASNPFRTLLRAENAKYYVWAGLTTALLALFTPITIYYIVFSFINLLLATATMLLSERNNGKNKLFKE